jgi:CBS domain-containing protein
MGKGLHKESNREVYELCITAVIMAPILRYLIRGSTYDERRSAMDLKKIMTPEVERLPKDASIQEVARKMKAIDVGTIPLYDGDRLVGMVTDRDIVLRVVAEGCDAASTLAHKVMTPEVVYCFEDQSVEEAGEIMEKHQIRRLIVLNRDKRLVGIVSLGDLATHRQAKKVAGEALSEISKAA